MPWLKWLPWRFAIGYYARAHGFLDPLALLARLQRFAQPSEVGEPIELLRAGAVFHARGLVNSRVIQHNLDWVWPYWVQRQFDPRDVAFMPRAFSITHVNLTHRNWTAVGLPDCTQYPIVDPRGLLTPFYDGWSLDSWIIGDNGDVLLPSRAASATQHLTSEPGLGVATEIQQGGMHLTSTVAMRGESASPVCRLSIQAKHASDAWLVVALRPYNPEGISFIHEVELNHNRTAWYVNGKHTVEFDSRADRHHVADYRAGDVFVHLHDQQDQQQGKCDVGMLTAAAIFRLNACKSRTVNVTIPYHSAVTAANKLPFMRRPPHMLAGASKTSAPALTSEAAWQRELQGHCQLQIANRQFKFLYDAAVRTLILHAPGDVYPGPYTYKRFWFRDAAFIVHALLCAGLLRRAEHVLDSFPSRQTAGGYFHSQEGEWDANGEVLWIMQRFCELNGSSPKQEWHKAIKRGANWIIRKRLSDQLDAAHAGLLPAGFSAEHLGPSDFYFWDDFWGIAGLRAAAALSSSVGKDSSQVRFERAACDFERAVARSLEKAVLRLGVEALPASPYRRLDAGAIGSLAVGYPLQLCAADDTRLLGSVEFLLCNCCVDGGFFQDMIHSGINPYLTLHIAQVLLRAEDARYLPLMQTVARLASATGQWPEAIHPHTKGGCMGDGQHVWAAAEWLMMLRHCFVREENSHLILCAGVASDWLGSDEPVRFGPAPTSFGAISITITLQRDTAEPVNASYVELSWRGEWYAGAPAIEIHLPGFDPVTPNVGQTSITLAQSKLQVDR